VRCRTLVVLDRAPPGRRPRPSRGAWATEHDWDRDTEALYAAWIEHLFRAPPDEEMTFSSLDPVLRDPARNFLHDHLGLGEDHPGAHARPITPDCADLPYMLRAYFAWKLGLPFGFRRCDRGSAGAPPRCGALTTNEDLPAAADPVRAFAAATRTIVDTVHSGSARTALGDESSDLYPVPLTRDAIRPGTVFADPYGHLLVVSGWVPQTPERAGLLLAIDAQPDNTVARKRFWEGTFLFGDVPSAGPGFKAFRPLVRDAPGGRLRPRTNVELAEDPRFTPWSAEQAVLDPDAFYARMARLINPDGLEPEHAYEAALGALVEQLDARVRAVDNGERFLRQRPGTVIPMPRGAAIFETIGPWEDFSTPSRDFRLLIAIKVVDGLPARIVRHPDAFRTGDRSPAAARTDVERLHRVPDHLDQHPLRAPAVELAVENLLPRAEVELAVGDRHDHLAAHDLPLVVGVAVVLARAVVVVALAGEGRTGPAAPASACSPRAGPARRR
jgi:hypothetical protein